MNNDSPSKPDNAAHKDSIENFEQYMLYNRAGIIQKLRQLGKSRNLITAHFGDGQFSMLTVVVDVMPDKDMLVLDYGSDEKMNKRMLAAKRIVFKTQHLGITAQFTCTSIQKAKRHGKSAFACNLPDSLLWVQRREFYRVKVPLNDNVTCELYHNDEAIQFPVLDISIGGLALHYTDQPIELEAGQVFYNCRLVLSNMGEGSVNLEVRNQLPGATSGLPSGSRIGCTFFDLPTDLSSTIQRYIHTIDSMRRRTEN